MRSMVRILATKTPIPTAAIKSTKTVRIITPYIIRAPLMEISWARFKKLQSMMSIPTFRAIPASTARGILAVRLAAPRITTNRIPARVNPERAVRPPVWMLTTVPIVAPAPAMPPNKPDIRLPIPWPMSSLLELCSVRVKLSATTEVSSASIQPNIPNTAASTNISCS